MREDFKLNVARVLNTFPEVQWDRMAVQEGGWVCYGWIARDDGRHDFMIITILDDGPGEMPRAGFTTSSAAYSEKFSQRLGSRSEHQPCQRVEDVMGDTVHHKVVL